MFDKKFLEQHIFEFVAVADEIADGLLARTTCNNICMIGPNVLHDDLGRVRSGRVVLYTVAPDRCEIGFIDGAEDRQLFGLVLKSLRKRFRLVRTFGATPHLVRSALQTWPSPEVAKLLADIPGAAV